ncbi:MAG: HD domain-containing protein [Candidatus Eremiobacteraeota bacterium]|nr:HD domain-containing protein [Candidatus Eremiobacteraeota bacterium]
MPYQHEAMLSQRADSVPLLKILLEQKNRATAEHCERVMRYSVQLACEAGVTGDAMHAVANGALLHDIGKLHVPSDLLAYPGPLEDDAMALVRTHALRGEDLLRRFPGLRMKDIARIVGAHHEWFDGSGYPRGLAARAIPYGARIVAICDAFDAMTAGRCYQRPRSYAAAIEELVACSGTQFDPELVRTFVGMGERYFRISS